VDPDDYARVAAKPEFRCALSYMGTYAPDRQQKLDAFFLDPARRRPDLEFLLAGSMYPWQWQWPVNVRRFDHVAPSEHSSLYSSSRLTLNITRAEMAASGYCPSGRLFEAAACGTPIVTDWFDGLDTFFEPETEILVVDDASDVISALEMSDEELSKIARAARERTLEQHTGRQRGEVLLRYLEEVRLGTTAHRHEGFGSEGIGAAS
jgi:spore maturation protein CgeB